MLGFHLLRNQTFLALLLICSIISFLTNVYRYYDMKRRDVAVSPVPSLDSINWKINMNISKFETGCQNSVQGSIIIVDEQGFVCSRQSLTKTGCCPLSSHRFSCRSCQVNGCCSVYEYCVSCCLHPEKRSLLQKTFLRSGRAFPHLFSSATNVFEVCLAKCRTSSQSVQHENAYRDPNLKHCYGTDIPAISLNL